MKSKTDQTRPLAGRASQAAAWAFAYVVLAAAAARSVADETSSTASQLASEFVKSTVELLRTEERSRFLHEETDRLRHDVLTAAGPTAFWHRIGKTRRESFDHLVARVQSTTGDLATDLDNAAKQAEHETNQLVMHWNQVREELYAEQLKLTTGRGPQPPPLADLVGVAVAASSLLLWAVAAALVTRHGWRRKILGGVGTGIAAFGLLSVIPFAAWWLAVGAPGRSWLTTGGPVLSDRPTTLPASQGALPGSQQKPAKGREEESSATKDHDEAMTQWTSTVSEQLPAPTSLVSDWLKVRSALENAAVERNVAGRIATAIEEDKRLLSEAAQQRSALAAEKSQSQAAAMRQRWLADAGLTGFLTVSWLGLALRSAKRRRREAQVCTKCQNVGTQELMMVGAGIDAGKYREYQCSARWDDTEACDFRISEEYRYATKLCFPTVGLPLAGKTHWLAVAYHKLKCGNYPGGLHFQRIATKTMEIMDNTVADLCRPGVRTLGATQMSLLDPLVFHVTDLDWMVPGRVLLNVFDYSGEVVSLRDIQDPLRQRMLRANGLFLFMDPERDPMTQLSEMDRFLADAERARLRAPAAVCLTKIDKFEQDQSATEPKWEFLQALRKLSREFNTGRENLAVIERRSRLTQRLVKGLWPEIDFNRRFRRAFGRGFRYFPITSTGFMGGVGQGEPQFVLEPLLWLLERNGYPVFSRSRRPGQSE